MINEKRMDDGNKFFIGLPDDATQPLNEPSMVMFWKNWENRTIWLTGEIDEDTMGIVDYILYFNREDAGIPVEQRKPIRLMINSFGGSLDVAEFIINSIEMSTTPIYGYAMGLCASAASTIYLACHKRFAIPNAYWVIHKGSGQIGGNYNEMMQAVDDYQKQVERMVKFYINHTSIAEDVIRANIKTDWYVHTDEALEGGICDEVLKSFDSLL